MVPETSATCEVEDVTRLVAGLGRHVWKIVNLFPHLGGELRRYFQTVNSVGMLCRFLENFFFRSSFGFEITIKAMISATHEFHCLLLAWIDTNDEAVSRPTLGRAFAPKVYPISQEVSITCR